MDAGPLYAALDADDRHHRECRKLLEEFGGALFVPILVVTEVAYLVATRLGPEAEAHFVADFAKGVLIAEQVAVDDWTRIVELVAHYHDVPLGTVDASLVVAAERLGMDSIATLDRRHFSVVRPAHAAAFQLLP